MGKTDLYIKCRSKGKATKWTEMKEARENQSIRIREILEFKFLNSERCRRTRICNGKYCVGFVKNIFFFDSRIQFFKLYVQNSLILCFLAKIQVGTENWAANQVVRN